ncbi:MAG: DUF2306 domain-containing protein [Sandarakinorhabdus sp.]|nr:DUF2306 domain-containing protein [Sandarakinorhabdus sp.]
MMAATQADRGVAKGQGLFDRLIPNGLLAALSVVLAASALLAIARGRPHWGQVPPLVWLHLGSTLVATVLTPVMLLRRKGDGRHRKLGYVWVGAMLLTAVTSLFFSIRAPQGWGVFTGDFSFIHILSVLVLLQVPRIVIAARAHNRARHERGVRGIVIGALLIAGFFTFPLGRMLGSWLFR